MIESELNPADSRPSTGNPSLTRINGSVYTPTEFADFLVDWAVQQPEDLVLDTGVGPGIFVRASYRRLIDLGASSESAQNQIYGAEIDPNAYADFTEQTKNLSIFFPNIHNIDLFQTSFPIVDAVVGNPPYVRRSQIENLETVRQVTVAANPELVNFPLTRLTDLYIYFLLYAAVFLKPGGRLAVITADSWLNSEYGESFKAYLKANFSVESIVSIDRPVFKDAQVKAVMLLAIKNEGKDQNLALINTAQSHVVQFLRVKNGLSLREVSDFIPMIETVENTEIANIGVSVASLNPTASWSVYFKAPRLIETFQKHPLFKPLNEIALTRIGLQTLAKEFFVLNSAAVTASGIEPEYLQPTAYSSRFFYQPIIDPLTHNAQAEISLFVCGKPRGELIGTNALQYIEEGERKTVQVRGKNQTVIGYHNKERIQQEGRPEWYDLATDLQRRGRASILIPRLIYKNYMVVWNKGEFVPGELFIEFIPHDTTIELEIWLALLNSSIFELLLRAYSQLYGGGTYNVSPGQLKKMRFIDATLLDSSSKQDLKRAYQEFIVNYQIGRDNLNRTVYQVLKLPKKEIDSLETILQDLRALSNSCQSKRTRKNNH